MSQPQMMHQSKPYMPTTWALGGANVKHIDLPVTAVFLVFYIFGAIMHMTILQTNQKKGHKFLFSGLLFGFNMARITTCVVRIASICKPKNISLGIAASVFVQAGVLLIFVVNLVFSQRIIRSQHPNLGWHKAFSIVFKTLYALIVVTLAILIVASVQTFETLDMHIRHIDRRLQLYGTTTIATISSLPFFFMALNYILPRRENIDKFGVGRHRSKVMILLLGTFFVSFGAWYRCGTSWKTPVPHNKPLPKYFNKGAFYVANFGVETLTNYLYGLSRVDQRFHVPDGAHGKGAYQAGYAEAAARKERTSVDDEASPHPVEHDMEAGFKA